MRAVSTDNPFDPDNVPPKEYLQDDVNFLEKPGTFNFKKADTLKYKYCGKLSKIGDEILRIGSYQAKHLVTGNWQFKQYNADGSIRELSKHSKRPGMDKITEYNPFDHKENPKSSKASSAMRGDSMMERLNEAMKQGYLTPLRDFNQSRSTLNNKLLNTKTCMETPRDSARSKYEVSRSPERDTLLRMMKEKREQRNATRSTNKKVHRDLRLLPQLNTLDSTY